MYISLESMAILSRYGGNNFYTLLPYESKCNIDTYLAGNQDQGSCFEYFPVAYSMIPELEKLNVN